MTYFDEFFDSCWAWTILLPSRSIKFDKLSKGAEKHLVKFGENCPRRNLVVQGNSHSNWPQVVLAGFLNNQQVCFFPKTPRNSRKLWRIGNRQVSLPYCERDHPHVPPNESHELVYASERITMSRKSQAFCLTQLHIENCKFIFVSAPIFVLALLATLPWFHPGAD